MAEIRRVKKFSELSIENATADSRDFNCSVHHETGTTSPRLPALYVGRFFLSEKKSKISSGHCSPLGRLVFTYLFIYILFLLIYLFICLFICLFACLFICLFIYLLFTVYLYVDLYLFSYLYLFIYSYFYYLFSYLLLI